MKKVLVSCLIIFFCVSFFSSRSYAFDFDIINKIKIPAFLFASPTPTPTPTTAPSPTTETAAPTATPTETPFTPTLTPTGILVTSPQPSPTITSTISPTPTTAPKQLSQKDIILAGVVGLLILMILFQTWPKIKTFLHEKTKP